MDPGSASGGQDDVDVVVVDVHDQGDDARWA